MSSSARMKKKILEAFKLPLKDRQSRYDVVIGGVMLFFPVIHFFSFGYLMRKLQKIIELDKKPLKWDEDLGNLFLWGVKGFLVIAGYLAIPVLLMFLGGVFTTSLSGGKILSLFFFRGQVINLLMSGFFFLALLFLPIALACMLEENNLKKAFDLAEILRRILLVPRDYLLAYLAILLLYVFSVAFIVLITTWVIGLLCSGFLLFYDGLVTIHLVGKVFPRKSVKIPVLPFAG